MALSGEAKAGFVIAAVIAVATMDIPWWWPYAPWSSKAGASTSSPIVGMSGGCSAYQVFAQNKYDPVGTAIREAPNVLSTQNGSYAPNQSITTNGWVHSRPAYPTNSAPWNSDIWFHLADGAGWAAFAGVRAVPTGPDPTHGLDGDTSHPAPAPANCEAGLK